MTGPRCGPTRPAEPAAVVRRTSAIFAVSAVFAFPVGSHAREGTTLWSLAARGERAAQARVLDCQLLDAGEQHPVQPILPPEVLLAVLEEPARERQQQPPLHEQDEAADR